MCRGWEVYRWRRASANKPRASQHLLRQTSFVLSAIIPWCLSCMPTNWMGSEQYTNRWCCWGELIKPPVTQSIRTLTVCLDGGTREKSRFLEIDHNRRDTNIIPRFHYLRLLSINLEISSQSIWRLGCIGEFKNQLRFKHEIHTTPRYLYYPPKAPKINMLKTCLVVITKLNNSNLPRTRFAGEYVAYHRRHR